MRDYIAIRKSRANGSKHIKPTIGLGLPLGEFLFYEPTMRLLNIDKQKEGLMFYISKKNKNARVKIEIKEDDNYHLADSKRSYSRFTNKQLGVLFAELLDLDMDKKYFFKLTKLKKKGVFEMTLLN